MSDPALNDPTELVQLAVDQDACIGAGQCEMLEAETFLLDDDTGIAALTGAGTLPRQRAEDVVDRCPARAISMVDQDDGAGG